MTQPETPINRVDAIQMMGATRPNIKAVVFDWDNTLARNTEAYHQSYFLRTFEAMRQLGYAPPNPFNFEDTKSQNLRKYYASLWGEEGAEKAMSLFSQVYDAIPYEAKLINGALDTLRWVRNHKVPVAILSSLPEAKLKKSIRELLGDEFSDIPVFGHGADGIRKPDPAAFRKVFDALAIQADPSIYFVGDHPVSDVCAAFENGLTPVHYGRDKNIPYKVFDNTELRQKEIINGALCTKDHAQLQALLNCIWLGKDPRATTIAA